MFQSPDLANAGPLSCYWIDKLRIACLALRQGAVPEQSRSSETMCQELFSPGRASHNTVTSVQSTQKNRDKTARLELLSACCLSAPERHMPINKTPLQTMVTPDCGRCAVQQAVAPGQDRQVAVVAAANVPRHGNAPAYDGVQHGHLPPHDACATSTGRLSAMMPPSATKARTAGRRHEKPMKA